MKILYKGINKHNVNHFIRVNVQLKSYVSIIYGKEIVKTRSDCKRDEFRFDFNSGEGVFFIQSVV